MLYFGKWRKDPAMPSVKTSRGQRGSGAFMPRVSAGGATTFAASPTGSFQEATPAALKPGVPGALARLTFREIEAGVPASALASAQDQGLTRDDILAIIPARTLERRIAEGQTLRLEEADAFVRLLRVVALAREVFSDPALADEFLRTPHPLLDDAQPIRAARSDLGGREVEAILQRIAHGVYS
jgi:putative toxin-antitoxin system antitoxin component (TIGR02293 family)